MTNLDSIEKYIKTELEPFITKEKLNEHVWSNFLSDVNENGDRKLVFKKKVKNESFGNIDYTITLEENDDQTFNLIQLEEYEKKKIQWTFKMHNEDVLFTEWAVIRMLPLIICNDEKGSQAFNIIKDKIKRNLFLDLLLVKSVQDKYFL